MRHLPENPRWSPSQRRLYRLLAWPLLAVALLVLVTGLVLLWIGLREGWFLPEPRPQR